MKPDFEAMLKSVGARFVWVFDVTAREGRTWDNAGSVEDVATGSAAGPAAAYLVRHGQAQPEEEIVLRQGRFLGRPSELRAWVYGTASRMDDVSVGGHVRLLVRGTFLTRGLVAAPR
ncbi:PhzF family phenazine biosynthesis protein [Pyxidicoccus sp. 3LG]